MTHQPLGPDTLPVGAIAISGQLGLHGMATLETEQAHLDGQLERRHLQQTIEALRFELEAERQTKSAEIQQVRAESFDEINQLKRTALATTRSTPTSIRS